MCLVLVCLLFVNREQSTEKQGTPLRILMANKYLYARAGAETYMLSVAAELRARGHHVAFFGMAHPENTTLGPVCAVPALEFGVRQTQFDALKNIGRAALSSAFGAVQKRLDAFISEFKPDLIHAHNIYNQLSPALFVKHTPHIPVLMTVHDYKPVCPNYSLFTHDKTCTRCLAHGFGECVRNRCVQGSFFKSTLAAASSYFHKQRGTYLRGYHLLIAPSQFLKKQLVAGGIAAERVSVLNNFAPAPAAFKSPGDSLLYFGRLCREKGVHTLIEAYAGMPEPRPLLRIAGEGPLSGELKQLADKKSLRNIQWLGRISPAEVAMELDACAYSVVPSVWFENCSMAILESLARGRAVVASDSGGNPDLVRAGVDGDIFRAGDVEHLRATLAALFAGGPDALRARANQMGLAARQAALERFSPSGHLDALLERYQAVSQTVKNGGLESVGGLA